MKKLMAVFALLFASAAVFLTAAFSASAAEEQLKDVGTNGLRISATADDGTDYTYSGGVLTIISSKKVTIAGAEDGSANNSDRIVVSSENGASITLNKVKLHHDSGAALGAVFEIDESTQKTVEITLVGDNDLYTTTAGRAGIQKNGGFCDLVINGSGKLIVRGIGGGACIGGASGESSSKITITGDAQIEIGNNFSGSGAFIGGGAGGNGSYITISGNASVKKTDNDSAKGGAFIGGGEGGEGSNITIKDNADVDALSNSGAGIGGGAGGAGSNIKIEGGTVKAKSTSGAGIGGGGMSGTGAGSKDGTNITITNGTVTAQSMYGAGIGGGGSTSSTGGAGKNITISGGTIIAYSNAGAGIGGGNSGGAGMGIKISGTADVKAAGSAGIGGGTGGNGGGDGDDNGITISGGKVTAICGQITISNDGTINMYTGNNGAGIGGGNGGNGTNITISGGEVTATGGKGGAGIGGGNVGDGSNIKIYGDANVTANGGNGDTNGRGSMFGGAGIGGGSGSITAGSTPGRAGTGIEISGNAIVTANGGNGGGAGIGGGGGGNGSTVGGNGGGNGDNEGITISENAKVVATGGSGGGAGIGGGYRADGINITIQGGTVDATINNGGSSTLGAGIGGGATGGNAENIKITGGKVTAIVTSSAAAIGGGTSNGGANGIEISGDAEVIAASNGGSGIGSGGGGTGICNNIKISGNAKVQAFSQGSGAGIGGGKVDTIEISGKANVTAIGAYQAAGIGCCNNGKEIKNISIYDNANVTAIATEQGAGIGGGTTASGISISGNATVVATGNKGGAGIGGGINGSCADITIGGDATVTAASTYNKDLYDQSIYDITLMFNGEEYTAAFGSGKIGEWLEGAATNAYGTNIGVGIGSNTTDKCVITIEGGTVTAYGDTKPGIGGENADVTIAGTSSTSCPIVYTNEIKSTTDPDDYPTEYWGIVFEDTHTNFDKGIVYGDGKEVDLSERTKAYVLGAGKVLTVLDDVTFIPGNKFKLDNSVLYLNEKATLEHWYEMTKVNGGEIKHVHSSQYEWYDVSDYSFVATDYTNLYKSGDKEGIVLCDICGKPEYHLLETGDGWEYDEDSHWHEGECEPGTDCSVGGQAIAECTYKKVFGGIFDQGEHIFGDPVKRDGRLYFTCTECDYEKSMEIPVITLIKIDGATNDPLTGAEFGLYTNAACTGTPSATGTTAMENGKAVVTFEGMPNMTYYIKETKAPDGYKLSDKKFKVTVNADGKVTYGDDGAETSPICENTTEDSEDPENPENPNNPANPANPENPNNPANPENPNNPENPENPNNPENPENPNNPENPENPNNPENPENPNNPENPENPNNPDNTGKPDGNDNPNTGIGIGIAGLALLGGSLCVASVKMGSQRRKK